jgi:hypothetical protein
MPRYFFELEVNGRVTRDAAGQDLEDREVARKLTNDIVRDLIKSRDHAKGLDCACTVLDEAGGHVYRHSLFIPAVTPEMLQAVEERKACRAAAKAAWLADQE